MEYLFEQVRHSQSMVILADNRGVLMHTLGDVDFFTEDLTRRTGRSTIEVTGAQRPVPLEYRYAMTPVHETIEELVTLGRAPVYVVHFTQAQAVERAVKGLRDAWER